MSTQLRMESEGIHYLGRLNQQLGLDSDLITSMMEDRFGRIWIGTFGGISIWDGKFLINLAEQEGLPGSRVMDILEDQNGNIWIALHNSGILVWDGDQFTQFTVDHGLSDNQARSLLEDPSGKIWIGTVNGLNLWDGKSFEQFTTDQGLSHNYVNALASDRNGLIWIGTWGGGINLWDGRQFSQLTSEQGLSNDAINKIIEDQRGNIWIATAGAGLNKWDGRGLTYLNRTEGLKEFWITDVMEDYQGHIWIAGNSGVQIYDGRGFSSISDSNGLKFNVVNSLFRDSSGRIWVGTAGGGIHIVTTPHTYHYVIDEPLTFWSGYRDLANASGEGMWILSRYPGLTSGQSSSKKTTKIELNGTSKLYEDSHGNLMLASGRGLSIVDPEELGKDKIRYLQYGFKGIRCMLEDRDGRMWLGGSRNTGLYFWDRLSNTNTDNHPFTNYSEDQGLVASRINDLLEDREGRIWAGSTNGIYVWDGSKFTHFTKQQGLSNNEIQALAMTRNGDIWIASWGGGLTIWDGNGFNNYNSQHGLPANRLNSLYVDKHDNVWAGTNSGLLKFWIEEDDRIHYQGFNEYQGVDRSNIVDALFDDDEKLWAISQHNMDIIDLNQQLPDTIRPKLSILGIQPFFDQFDWRHGRASILKGEKIYKDANSEQLFIGDKKLPISTVMFDSVIAFTNLPAHLELPHNINHVTFQWSASYWADPISMQYSYLLEGKDLSWAPLTSENKITYQDLRPGAYTLKVRAVGSNARWSETASYSLRVRPPIWATSWAYAFYGLCALSLVLGLRMYERKRFVLRQKAKSLEEIDKVKTEFFTNISHELRTPLTLILGPLKAIQEGTFKGDKSSMMIMMSQNGRRLLQLVNQLLDLSKLDQGKLKLELEDCHVDGLVQSVVYNFDSAFSMKHIELEFHENDPPVYSRLDKEKIRQVLFNLMGNAIKFTPEGGHIKVSINSVAQQQQGGYAESIKIVVKDSGIGIDPEELGHIFDRFYQVNNPNQEETEGTGIGLALAQNLVHLHKGTIEVESETGWGTTFTVTLPKLTVTAKPEAVPERDDKTVMVPVIEPDLVLSEPAEGTNSNLPILLIVEDNAQMRQFIRSCLGESYHCIEASNGEEGLKMANNQLPDLILCDVMMPKMDGYEFCENIRSNPATGHIPFIFLTAKADPDSRRRGLEIGSNDYLPKPFDAEELRLKVRNHLSKIRQYRSFFSKQLAIGGAIDPVESLDEKFLKRAIKVVEDKMDNHELSVNSFAHEAGMSQTQLYRKLMALTGQSPSAFIRSIRLKKAAQLIVQDYGNTSDVAYAVGFNNLSYFAKCFKEQFGVAPSGYGKNKIPANEN